MALQEYPVPSDHTLSWFWVHGVASWSGGWALFAGVCWPTLRRNPAGPAWLSAFLCEYRPEGVYPKHSERPQTAPINHMASVHFWIRIKPKDTLPLVFHQKRLEDVTGATAAAGFTQTCSKYCGCQWRRQSFQISIFVVDKATMRQCAEHKGGFAWCIYIGSLSLSHLDSGCSHSIYQDAGIFNTTCWWPVAGNLSALARKQGQISSSLRDPSPTPFLCFPFFLSAQRWRCRPRGCACVYMMQRLRCKGETCRSLQEMKAPDLSAHFFIRVQREPGFRGGSGKWRRKWAQSEKTLQRFHLKLFDVPPSGDFGHYFMSIIKKTSNKMLNSKSDHTEIEMCVSCVTPLHTHTHRHSVSLFKLS